MKKKLQDILKYADLDTIIDWCVNITDAVIHDEFQSESRAGDYRNRAIDRLIKMGIDWGTENNISWEVAKRFVKIVCPYCGKDMNFTGHSGRLYACECGASASPSVTVYFKAPTKAGNS